MMCPALHFDDLELDTSGFEKGRRSSEIVKTRNCPALVGGTATV